MMKDCRTVEVGTILEEFEEEKRNEIIRTFDSCMRAICAADLDWKKFLVFVPGVELMKFILESNSPEYFLAIADELLANGEREKTVKFSLIRGIRSEIQTIRHDGSIMVLVILSKKDLKKLVEGI